MSLRRKTTRPKATLTVQEVADLLGINLNAAYSLMRQPGFPVLRIGKRWVVPEAAFWRWLNGAECQENAAHN